MKLSNKIGDWFSYRMEDVKYKESFTVIQLITYIGIPLFILLPYLYPEFFPWITNLKHYFILVVSYLFINIAITVTLNLINKGSYYPYTGYIGVTAYVILIYLTGGVNSSFIFILSFVPILSVAFLNEKVTRNLGVFSVLLLASMIFWDKSYEDPSLITKHALNVLGYSLIVYFIIKLIKEILFQRYEKEHYRRKFVELTEVNNVKETFITSISHQLRTPLNGAKWAIQAAMESDPNSKFLKDGYEKINQSINTVGEILKSTELDVSKEFFQLKKEKINLCEMVDSILESLNFLIKGKNISLDYNKCLDFNILGDRKTLELGLSNVFDNAFRYSPNGKVYVSMEKMGKNIKLRVNDNGIGIDSADMEYMFQKFFRGKNAIKVDPNESGIGLYATKKIIEMHSGEIKLESKIGKGTKVEISLPSMD
jgi:signal transduction histidine kinase